MSEEDKQGITKMAKQFVKGFKDIPLNGSGWLIIDPFSAFLNASGHKNTLKEMPACKEHCQVLIMEFPDGSMFVPAGEDLNFKGAKNYMWI